ncbi:MAG: 23S rRNA (pseudouridine(1915)-N(3))-methyltransferase RlmH [Firmicutes bacterium]|nr:23S rRNA (pseudouridine(1915)-N(3))-methyltransferase RlmH [Bacillota bacterium]
MLQFTVIAVGKLKEKYLIQACQEYLKRLRPAVKVRVVELKDEPLPAIGSPDEAGAKEIEGKRILAALPQGAVKIALDPMGRELSSPEFAHLLNQYALAGRSSFAFIIGGGAGLAETVRRASDEVLSFSRLTFPHQLFRVILLEQLYRAVKIIRNEPYHR